MLYINSNNKIMQYIVIPKSKIEEVSQEELDALHLSPRYSDGSEVIMKLVHYEALFPAPMTLSIVEGEDQAPVVYPYPTYEGEGLNKLLEGKSWASKGEL